ncbi:peptidoglycan-binding protein [Sulfurovum sp. bin170]|uniref:peptidoglycan-binding domain-containing protein n=1 Tax=Sulfurovum sp. bin170 TaxID=2695268 RepID=UPI0013E05246|nr:peptidoglycan-binding domain-containing protein [Sulfurovum sp. bin170]NEW61460.1 peptidoglycan-binding protein [Sulfurovum sp. bin170]
MSNQNIEDSDFESIKLGCQGSMVLIAQKMLNSIGYGLEENGNFDENMATIVRDFQIKSNSLAVDGVIDAETMIAIDSAIDLRKVS